MFIVHFIMGLLKYQIWVVLHWIVFFLCFYFLGEMFTIFSWFIAIKCG